MKLKTDKSWRKYYYEIRTMRASTPTLRRMTRNGWQCVPAAPNLKILGIWADPVYEPDPLIMIRAIRR